MLLTLSNAVIKHTCQLHTSLNTHTHKHDTCPILHTTVTLNDLEKLLSISISCLVIIIHFMFLDIFIFRQKFKTTTTGLLQNGLYNIFISNWIYIHTHSLGFIYQQVENDVNFQCIHVFE